MKVLDELLVPDPATLVNDMNALGADGLASYAFDDDVSINPTVRAEHVQAVRAAGKKFLPIITQRSNSPADAGTLIAALQTIACPSGPVAWDIEPTAEPPFSTLQSIVGTLRLNGYGPIDAYFWNNPVNGGPPSLATRYGSLFDNWWWGDVQQGSGLLPITWDGAQYGAPWRGVQYGAETGPSGTTYDVNIYDPAMFTGSFTPPPVLTGEQDMNAVCLYDPALDLQHFAVVAPNGDLWYSHWDNKTQANGPFLHILSGLDQSGIDMQLMPGPSGAHQLHIMGRYAALNQAGWGAHLWSSDFTNWGTETR